MIIAPGTQNNSFILQIVDDDGLPVTGLVAATFPAITIIYGTAEITPALSNLAAFTSAHADGGVKEAPSEGGYYRFDAPDAPFATELSQIKLNGEASGKRVIHEPIQVGLDVSSVGGLPVDVGQFNVNVVNASKVIKGTLILFRGEDCSLANGNAIHFDNVTNIAGAEQLYLTIVNTHTETALFTRRASAVFSIMDQTCDWEATASELTVDTGAFYAFVVERQVGAEYNPILVGPCTIKDNNRTFP